MVIREIQKNSRERLRVSLDQFRGHDLIAMRVWIDGDEGPIPTKSGFGLRVHQIPELREVLAEAERQARANGMLEDAA
ncbi:MAG: PC4/YdbC family ssDNA-binding protein [Minwuia sp.]|uniref:PC4/YdbC family ssDNA-binding protein n=1 Tax=Minwuia sp. TaxID=2493630 RepID=UPI003A8361E8